MTAAARKTFIASFLGWSLDAFDFFLLTFVIGRIATSFGQAIPQVALAITLTLACRPIGALLFGWAADRYGRHPTLMVNIVAYSVLELASAGAPSLPVLIGLLNDPAVDISWPAEELLHWVAGEKSPAAPDCRSTKSISRVR